MVLMLVVCVLSFWRGLILLLVAIFLNCANGLRLVYA
jgi:hypothetical protein